MAVVAFGCDPSNHGDVIEAMVFGKVGVRLSATWRRDDDSSTDVESELESSNCGFHHPLGFHFMNTHPWGFHETAWSGLDQAPGPESPKQKEGSHHNVPGW